MWGDRKDRWLDKVQRISEKLGNYLILLDKDGLSLAGCATAVSPFPRIFGHLAECQPLRLGSWHEAG